MSHSGITLHPPSSKDRSLCEGTFDRQWFMGKWGVAWSTLSMWKGKKAQPHSTYNSLGSDVIMSSKAIMSLAVPLLIPNIYLDVAITYTPIPGTDNHTKFEDLVEYRKQSASDNSKPSSVKGVDTLTPGSNAATFDWKGSSYLFFVHSHWEVLGYGTDQVNGLEWAVTFFSKTLFTPAGIDIYLRASPNTANPNSQDTAIRANLLQEIVKAVKGVQEGGVGEMAQEGFEVPGIV
ncbi:uncharacterized protein IL334_003361 [Kwoniella shivajii]|uniref:Uncharacterized protein n=1 Tax=Kwoniella shivajii TaxID=564305 RepID=A0ABZ1CXN0_9TREE|nr:hypothetical protein IL334_003361 [Kwoniella shivajii]